MNSSKVKSIKQITRIISRLKKSGKKIVFTNGCFDILHIGHIRLLQKAKSFGEILVIGLNTDSSVRRIKTDGRPIIQENERAEILSALNMVDFVVKFSASAPYELIKKIKPDVLVKGADWKSGKIIGSEFSKQVKRVALVKGRSTTKTIKKLGNL
ncbi:MAG: adenylyltransferase/cytidyltransferase family protein [Elusimicrobia bacterium]|nr:adenylyltransferase/cytidyltransferase family protein [Elusimicrobiota bacterium]